MELVVDANILFSALIKESTTRELMLNDELLLRTPEFILGEFLGHIDELEKKTHARKGMLKEKIIELILQSDINIIPKDELRSFIGKAKSISPDPDDFMYFAVALKLNCAIWSNDKELKKQSIVMIYSTEDLVKCIIK
ncbi:MAG: PIN domain-containing protein [Candidatus Thermoplasmatota archaeon]|nr:PIN domain-containing protein [Candidatus Thermoplasmatota archaeon]